MAKKAQMFIITALFLIGLVFSVQQLLFQYTTLDMSAPFRENNVYFLKNTKDVINKTIKTTPDCSEFSTNMDELKDFLDKRIPRGGYSLSISYILNCTYWNSVPPQTAPLNLTIQIVGKNVNTFTMMGMYRNG